MSRSLTEEPTRFRTVQPRTESPHAKVWFSYLDLQVYNVVETPKPLDFPSLAWEYTLSFVRSQRVGEVR